MRREARIEAKLATKKVPKVREPFSDNYGDEEERKHK